MSAPLASETEPVIVPRSDWARAKSKLKVERRSRRRVLIMTTWSPDSIMNLKN
jgi:hypothetical protein